jgi:hypothetical protein
MINRRGEGFIGKQGDNIYAGRDGNAYRRDQNGNWSKWENGQWNNVQRPNGSNSVRDSMLNDQARQRQNQIGNTGTRRDGASGDLKSQLMRPLTLDSSTFNRLNRDASARREGGQRTRDFDSFQNRTSSRPSNMGSYRGGGFSRGGGFRGGGRRR